ncbi:MAG: DUF4185 domain-containing protein [Gemmataceae bacterium]
MLALAFLLIAPSEVPRVASAEPAPEWNARFRRTQGWVGADGAYSVPVSDKKTLWLFSDTFVGSIENGKRKNVTMVNNTIGLQAGEKVEFAIRSTPDEKPMAMLVPPKGTAGWFWLQGGVRVGNKLNLFLPRIETTGKGGAFGFQHVDQWLGTVSNPDDTPAKWKTEYAKIPHGKSWGAAVLQHGGHAYIYGYVETPAKPFAERKLLTARVPPEKIADFDAWRFLSNGEWKADAKLATPQIDKLATECSVSYVPGLKRFTLVYMEHGLGDRIMGRFSADPAGPWSEPVLLYCCPEMKANKKLFSYAAKAHPHLAGDRELVLTYCVNAFELGPVINDATLYWPNFVRVKFE